ncbi:MAG TPA: type II toxin-antitoxin system VapB family antitoxin [Dongiaceae bacterium]|jgi:antitoxin VapB|nr:type II toxin-antitoxin system VapB family antitoxin [Dongiaceae bacterium]
MEDLAKLFWSGRSQAVRLPKEYRFEGEAVRIRRHGATVILEPLPKDWTWLDAISGPLDADMVEAARKQPAPQRRRGLDKLFRK